MEKNNLQIFTERVNNLIECKLILTDKAIAHLLKCIAVTKPMMDVVTESLKEVSYATEFVRARTTITKPDGSIQSKLKLPQVDTRLFTFVVCLLTEFDTGRRSLVEFLKEYFSNDDSNVSYTAFANLVLKPFKRAGEHILRDIDPKSVDNAVDETAQRYFDAERIYINSEVMDDLLEELGNAQIKLNGESFYSQQDKADCLEMLNAMKNAILAKNPKLIRLIWIGFFNTLRPYKSCDFILRRINNVLVENNLI